MSEIIEGAFALRELQTGGITPQRLLCSPEEARIPEGFELVQRVRDGWHPWVKPERAQIIDQIRDGLAEIAGLVDELETGGSA